MNRLVHAIALPAHPFMFDAGCLCCLSPQIMASRLLCDSAEGVGEIGAQNVAAEQLRWLYPMNKPCLCRHNGSKADKPADTIVPQHPPQQGPGLSGAGSVSPECAHPWGSPHHWQDRWAAVPERGDLTSAVFQLWVMDARNEHQGMLTVVWATGDHLRCCLALI